VRGRDPAARIESPCPSSGNLLVKDDPSNARSESRQAGAASPVVRRAPPCHMRSVHVGFAARVNPEFKVWRLERSVGARTRICRPNRAYRVEADNARWFLLHQWQISVVHNCDREKSRNVAVERTAGGRCEWERCATVRRLPPACAARRGGQEGRSTR